MKIIAKKNRELALINARNTQNENKAETIELIVPEEYESYNKKIVFVTDDGTVWDIITNNEYKITNAITKYDKVDFYIWLTKEVDGESIDFRTKTKTLNFYHNVDASDEITDEEIHGVNTVVNLLEEEIEKVENLNIEATKIGSTTTVTITKKDGTTESVDITDGQNGQDGKDGVDGKDGKDGQDGKDAKINGKNSIEIEAGNNITIDNTENGIRINSTGGSGGTSNYNDLSNKPKINNVELNGNKSLNDLGIQPAGNYLISETDPTVPSYVKNITQTNITNWNNKSDFSGSYNDLSNKPTIPEELKDLSDDSTHRLVTDTEKSTWNNKSDFSGNYNDLTNKPSEVTETTVSNWGFTKNTGTYSKPSTGIPKTDLASEVQTSLGKADTALQSHQDISGKANKISVVQTSASTIEINSNTFYKFGEVASLNITLASITDNTIYNEFMFEFVSGSTATTLTLPDTIKWLETPTIESNKIYQCSIVDNIGVLLGVANV